jgi:lipopolysaccharide transport system permease protein
MWTVREIKIRYKQSILGGAWAILQPLALTIIFTVVFSYFARIDTGEIPYPLFAYTALLPWTLLSTAISFAVPSLVNNMQLVTKIYFPREILPLASIAAAVVDFMIGIGLLILLMVYYKVPLTVQFLWLPLLVLIQVLLITGVSLCLAAANVFYRDIRFVITLFLQVWMYASPVIYPETMVPEKYRILYNLNPMAGIIASYRRVLLQDLPPLQFEMILAGLVSVLLLVTGYWFFKKVEPDFADII